MDPTSDDAREAVGSSSAPTRATANPRLISAVVAAPPRRTFFDPWNSSSTGHQRAENRLGGSTSWRASRSLKLGEQFKAGRQGGKRVADTVGAGSEEFGRDGRKENASWDVGAKGLRGGGQKSLAEVWAASKAGRSSKSSQEKHVEGIAHVSNDKPTAPSAAATNSDVSLAPEKPPEKQIFAGLTFYLNGSTAPLVSDHKLKQLCAAHGATHSISLGRRTVTHFILGRVNTIGSGGGAGGGLAASKLQKEITRTGGKAVRFINAEWVLDSVKAGRRLPESRYLPLKLVHHSQNSVLGMMRGGAARSTQHQQQEQG